MLKRFINTEILEDVCVKKIGEDEITYLHVERI
jgi:hypothetical protein